MLETVAAQHVELALPLLKMVAADLALDNGLSTEQSKRWLEIAQTVLKRCESPSTLLNALDALQSGLIAQMKDDRAAAERAVFVRTSADRPNLTHAAR